MEYFINYIRCTCFSSINVITISIFGLFKVISSKIPNLIGLPCNAVIQGTSVGTSFAWSLFQILMTLFSVAALAKGWPSS